MKYDFDKIVDRRNTGSVKWDTNKDRSILPLWVADMDFPSPQPIIDAIKQKMELGIFGYSFPPDSYYEAIMGWLKKRHNWEIKRDWITWSPGTVTALHMLIRAYTEPGDKVIIQKPVYYPFFVSIKNNHCEIVDNPLKYVNGRYVMDFDDLEVKTQDPKAKVLILCSPHNPVGRVWTKEELSRLGEICLRNKVIVLSDEVHHDLIYKGYQHISLAAINEEFAQNSVTCIAPSKTFNLAGLQTSVIIIPDERPRQLYDTVLFGNYLKRPNLFGIAALEAGYRHGEEWLEQLLEYLEGNLNFLIDFIKQKLPRIKVIRPQGTYLVWMDFRELGMDAKALEEFMLNKAKLWLDEGYIFGEGGVGFERINIACSRATLTEALHRLEKAVHDLP